MIELLTSPEAWAGFLTLAALEIVLGIDNIVFITIITSRLPQEQQLKARRTGLGLALISRLVLLAFIAWIAKLTYPLFTLTLGEWVHEVAGRDLILLAGGLFLIAKATWEIYEKVEVEAAAAHGPGALPKPAVSYGKMLAQIMVIDLVFSLDSVITAVGMVSELSIMVAAVVVAVLVMMVFARPVGDFVERHPSVKILALSFLVMIGILLVAEGMHQHFNRGFVYFGMFFALTVEMLQMRYRSRATAAGPAGADELAADGGPAPPA